VTELDRLEHTAILGIGSYGKVTLCRDRLTDRYFALKSIDKRRLLKSSMMYHVVEEKHAMATANSPFVVRPLFSPPK
jgi:serine/threonine protein kinase